MSQSAALAFIMTQHAAEQAAIAPPVIITRGARVTEVAQPAVVKLDAKGFLVAMRNAGRRQNQEGRWFTNPSKVREDSIAAIHAYVGYDRAGNFGPQELAARTKANRELTGRPFQGPSLAETKAAHRSAAGFVAGVPDSDAKGIQDLLAREVLAAAEMVRHQRDAEDTSRSAEQRALSAGLAQYEGERLTCIRADLTAWGVKVGNAR